MRTMKNTTAATSATLCSSRHPFPAAVPEEQTAEYHQSSSSGGRRVSIVVAEQKVQNFARAYIIGQLERRGHNSLVERLVGSYRPPSDRAAKCLNMIATQLAEERREQLEEICFDLQITKETLKETFDTIADEMFNDSVKWGRIVTFIAFTGALAEYCADHGLEEEVEKIIEWTEEFVHERLMGWIARSGGWEGFIGHFQENNVCLSQPKLMAVGMTMAALAVAGGMFMVSRLL